MSNTKDLKINFKEIFLWLVFGGLTTVISVASFWGLNQLGLDELISNIFSWIIAVTFAFFTNKFWVFNSPLTSKKSFVKQFVSFYGFRLITLLIEEIIIAIFVTWLTFNSLVVKIVAQIIIIALNYILSKLFVFKKENNLKTTDDSESNSKKEE